MNSSSSCLGKKRELDLEDCIASIIAPEPDRKRVRVADSLEDESLRAMIWHGFNLRDYDTAFTDSRRRSRSGER